MWNCLLGKFVPRQMTFWCCTANVLLNFCCLIIIVLKKRLRTQFIIYFSLTHFKMPNVSSVFHKLLIKLSNKPLSLCTSYNRTLMMITLLFFEYWKYQTGWLQFAFVYEMAFGGHCCRQKMNNSCLKISFLYIFCLFSNEYIRDTKYWLYVLVWFRPTSIILKCLWSYMKCCLFSDLLNNVIKSRLSGVNDIYYKETAVVYITLLKTQNYIT